MAPTMKDLGIDRMSIEDQISLAQEIWESLRRRLSPSVALLWPLVQLALPGAVTGALEQGILSGEACANLHGPPRSDGTDKQKCLIIPLEAVGA